jgi:predicted metal-binding membrane protein
MATSPPAVGTSRPRLPAPAAALFVVFGAVVVVAWAVTILSSSNFMTLLGGELSGATPVNSLTFVALAAVMMAAMMLPSSVPMLATYRGLASLDAGPTEGALRASVLGAAYVLVWGVFAAGALVIAMALGLMGSLSGPLIVIPGAILVAAGFYQFSSLKRTCLEGCQTPGGFLLARWRGGRRGAARLGLTYAAYCLGCCWLLMLVVFVTGAMGLLWMGVFTGLVLVEKVVGESRWFTRGLGLVATSAGALVTAASLGLLGPV